MGTYALNVLDERNWVVVGDRREYRSPPAEAEHLARLDEYHSGRRRSSEIESKIQLAIHDLTHATTAVARESVEFATGELPEIGSASCRERGCPVRVDHGGSRTIKKK